MNDPHIIRKVERNGSCIYCNESLENSKWTSDFAQGVHYKCVICTCGKQNCARVNFIGSGHDKWSGLEKKVVKSNTKVEESKIRML